jgi:peptidoglycan/LPS O-acetylase OafA/YrhL
MKLDTFHSLDLLRGVAALAVLMLHSGQVISIDLMVSGYLAVDVFFVLSGFVIASSYSARLQAGWGLGRFFLARVVRFFPLHMLGIALGGLATLAGVFLGQMRDVDPGDVLFSLGFAFFFLPTPGSEISTNLFPLNPPSWSLFFELVVNLVFAGFFLWFSKRFTVIVVLSSSLALVFGIYLIGDGSEGFRWEAVGYGIPRVIFSFFLGVLIFQFRDQFPRKPRSSFLAPSLVLVFVFSMDPGNYRAIFDAVFVTIVSPIILIWAYQAEIPQRWRSLSSYLGGISFCVYSIHLPLLNIAKGAHRVLGFDLGLVVVFVVLVVLASSPIIVSRFDVPARKKLLSRFGASSAGTPRA